MYVCLAGCIFRLEGEGLDALCTLVVDVELAVHQCRGAYGEVVALETHVCGAREQSVGSLHRGVEVLDDGLKEEHTPRARLPPFLMDVEEIAAWGLSTVVNAEGIGRTHGLVDRCSEVERFVADDGRCLEEHFVPAFVVLAGGLRHRCIVNRAFGMEDVAVGSTLRGGVCRAGKESNTQYALPLQSCDGRVGGRIETDGHLHQSAFAGSHSGEVVAAERLRAISIIYLVLSLRAKGGGKEEE